MTGLARLLPVALGVALAGCAHQVPAAVEPEAPGFLLGVWHGFIFPFAWVASLFTDVTIYAVPNNGGWYNFGYFIGIMFLGTGAHRGKRVVYRTRVIDTGGPVIDQ